MESAPKELIEKGGVDNLRRALETLAPDQRRLLARYLMGEQLEERIQSRKALCDELGIPLNALRIRVYRLRRQIMQRMAELVVDADAPTMPAEKPNSVFPASVTTQPTHRQAPLLEPLRHLLQTRFPMLYAQVLEPTLADLREEHSAALADGDPFKARWIFLRGCGALASAGICQLGRIAALWKARSPK